MLSETDVARDIYTVEKATPSQRPKVPKELAFEEIVKNNTLSPCSLNEFMDYLVCEESNAELLQFFTWFCHYVERWSELPPKEKTPSPPWKPPNPVERSRTNLSIHTHRRAGSDRLDQILEILDRRSASDNTGGAPGQIPQEINSDARDVPTPRRFSAFQTAQLQLSRSNRLRKQVTVVENTAENLANQPFQHEVMMIVDHYIRDGAPRRLKISHNDLRECLDAVQTTTHPSALLPAFTAAETILKSRTHADFLRKSQRNACAARLIFVQAIGIFLFLLGVSADAAFILSSLSRFFRLISLALWWPGLTLLVAATKGICVFLYVRNLRQLRPWEQVPYTGGAAKSDDDGDDKELSNDGANKEAGEQTRSKGRWSSSVPADQIIDPLRKPSMQVFGEANDWEREARMEVYEAKPLRCKVLNETVKTQNRVVRLLQDRVVLMSVCWAGFISTLLMVGSLFVPEVHLF